jgi:glycosyltransferase involved in cell wall biosynthesis
MQSDPVSVMLAAGVPPYQKTLAASLLQVGMLRRVCDLGPYLDIREPDGNGSLKTIKRFPAYRFSMRVSWAIWRRLLPKSVFPWPPSELNVWLADRLISKWVAPGAIFHGCTAMCLASLAAAKRQGVITLVESASRHPRHWKQTRLEEGERIGVPARDTIKVLDEMLLRRRDEEFKLCDRIVVPSTAAQRSFAEMGYAEKTEVVPLGVNADFFVPRRADAQPSSPFRVCYVGRVEAAKGIGYLLQAWKRLALPRAELVLVGEVKDEMKPFLKTYANCNVRFTGVLPPQELAHCYHESTVSVFPSPNEGFGMVLLEAMASGLPTIGTDMTGAVDCMKNRKDGIIVPARNVDALADAILWCYQHPEESRVMGRAARARIEREFTLEHYNQRIIALYRSLVT